MVARMNIDSRIISFMAAYYLNYLQTVEATSASIFNSNSKTSSISFTLSLYEKFSKLYYFD